MESDTSTTDGPRWQSLDRIQRRVVGVLVEKAKTTPDNYPLSLKALLNGCNQKSNRAPQMQLDGDQIDEAIDRLRKIGAVAVVQGDGRVDKYRHLLYDWLGVDKAELAVMAELLLRGAQTLGDLRARAARMEPIPGITELRPIVDSLQQKGLLVLLTPPGRGCVVTHTLYQDQELAKLRSEFGDSTVVGSPAIKEPTQIAVPVASSGAEAGARPLQETVDVIKQEFTELREQVSRLRMEVDELKGQLGG